jgi:hypothetical protein
MGTTLDRELKKGSAELLILALLEEKARHGYEIGKLIAERSEGIVRFHVAPLPARTPWLGEGGMGTRRRAPPPLLPTNFNWPQDPRHPTGPLARIL